MNSPTTPTTPIRLTSFSHGGGCGCKVAPGLLTEILRGVRHLHHNGHEVTIMHVIDPAEMHLTFSGLVELRAKHKLDDVLAGAKTELEKMIRLRHWVSQQWKYNPPTPYPWTVRGIGDNCSLVDVLLVNPYQAVDFGTQPAGTWAQAFLDPRS